MPHSRSDFDIYKSLISSIKDGFVIQAESGQVLEHNQAACDILMLSSDQLLGKTSSDEQWAAIDFLGKPMEGQDHPAMVALRENRNVEKRFFVRGGNSLYKLIDVRSSVVKKESDESIVLTIFRDVTFDFLTDKANKAVGGILNDYIEQRDNIKTFFSFLLDRIIKISSSGYGFIGEVKQKNGKPFLKTYAITDISWNEETRKFYHENEEAGLEFYNLDSLFGEVLKTQKPLWTNEAKSHPKACGIPSGHPPLDRFMGVPLFYNNEMIAMIGIANSRYGYDEKIYQSFQSLFSVVGEVIGRWKLEEDLREQNLEYELQQQKIKHINKVADIALWEWNLDTNSLYTNDTWWTRLGHSRPERTGELSDWESRVHPEDIEEAIKEVQAVVEGIRPAFDMTYRFKMVDGSDQWVLDRGAVTKRDTEGRPIQITGMHVDITELIRAKEEVENQRSLAEKASRIKTEFLANMSHEIRTPMNAIIGFTELVLDGDLDQDQRSMVENIGNSGKALLTIINDILDFSKMETGHLKVEEIPFKPFEVVQSSYDLFSELAKEKGIDFKLVLRGDRNGALLGDPTRIGQIVNNFLSNAIKFSESKPVSLVLEQHNLEDACELCFMVIDNGLGLSEEEKDRVFTYFTQADSSITRKYGGTGLGLSICRRLAELMNGEVSVESSPGQGSTFSFKATFSKADAVPKDKDIKDRDSLSMQFVPKTLLVEDHDINLKLAIKFLTKLGIEPDVARNGLEAVDMARKNKYQLIFMDLQMPVMGGLEATQKIRALNLKDQPYIVAMTANAFEEDRQACLNAGMNNFMSKPIRKQLLVEVLEEVGSQKGSSLRESS
jgi:PAS domain S-box-containing protein